MSGGGSGDKARDASGDSLQGFECQAAELGPCLRQWRGAEGQGVRGSLLREEGCRLSPRLPLSPFPVQACLQLYAILGCLDLGWAWAAGPTPKGSEKASQSRGPPTAAHPRSTALTRKGLPVLWKTQGWFGRHSPREAVCTGQSMTPGAH